MYEPASRERSKAVCLHQHGFDMHICLLFSSLSEILVVNNTMRQDV